MSRQPRTVAIIGAGPAGLVMAKTLICSYSTGTFEPTVFERTDEVGGMWPTSPKGVLGRLDPQMPVNISRYVVGFSDLAWDAVGNTVTVPSNGKGSASTDRPHVPLFPKAFQVGEYLKAYVKKYIPSDRIKFGSNVLDATPLKGDKWQLKWTTQGVDDGKGQDFQFGTFDYLVLATGFFASSKRPYSLSLTSSLIPYVHSANLWTETQSLFHSGQKRPGDKVVVVGGSLSGAEAAASIAFHLSSAKWSPESDSHSVDTKVIHLASKPFWNVPRLLPDSYSSKDDCTGHKSFFPNDFGFYDISRRLPEPISPRVGPLEPDNCRLVHGYLESIVGSDQAELSPALQVTDNYRTRPPSLGISDNYSAFSRNGDISFIRGTFTNLEGGPDEAATLTYKAEDGNSIQLTDVSCVIVASGYSPHPALSPLTAETLSLLNHDLTSDAYPLLLDDASTHHASVPTLAFVGFYRGPFWGVMEMQARSIAARWMDGVAIPGLPGRESDAVMRENQWDPLRLQQFPMRDVAGLSETFARGLGISRTESRLPEGRIGMAMPARYLDRGSDVKEAEKTMESWRRAVRDMSGTKRLDSRLSSSPSGTFVGEASFHPRTPTDPAFDSEYLYIEDGIFTTDSGLQFNGTRRYVYRYQERCDTLSVWFVKVDANKIVDYFFHELHFVPRTEDSEPNRFRAESEHLCIKDLYTPSYEFAFKGTSLVEFEVVYKVKGPEKDYESSARYTKEKQ